MTSIKLGEVVGKSEPTILELPPEDLLRPRAERRFPFRRPAPGQFPPDREKAEIAAINVAVDSVLASIENMFYLTAYRVFRTRSKHVDIEDLVEKCRLHLWNRSLPKFDAHHKTPAKVQTFAFQCMMFFYRTERRTLNRAQQSTRKIRMAHGDGDEYLRQQTAPSRLEDRQVERVAAAILAAPERYLTVQQAKVLRAVIAAPHKPKQVIARELGYRGASSLSMVLQRITERIQELSLWDTAEEVGPCQ